MKPVTLVRVIAPPEAVLGLVARIKTVIDLGTPKEPMEAVTPPHLHHPSPRNAPFTRLGGR